MNLFGRRRSKPRGAPASKDPAQTIVSLRGTLDTLEKRQAHLDKQIAKQVAEAKASPSAKIKCRGASPLMVNHDLHASDATSAR